MYQDELIDLKLINHGYINTLAITIMTGSMSHWQTKHQPLL
jgi:hypothetical protein